MWQVIFAQGFVGLGLFLTFFVMALTRCWRCRTTVETLCTFTVAFFLLLLPVYDTLGMPLVAVMMAIGLLAREQRATARAGTTSYLEPALARLRAAWPLLLVTTLLGATLGGAVAALEPVQHSTRLSILLTPPPVYLSTDDQDDQRLRTSLRQRGDDRHRGRAVGLAAVAEPRGRRAPTPRLSTSCGNGSG